MKDPVATSAIIAIAGGLLSLDRVAFLQSLISRPLPTAAIIGLIVGEPALGLLLGLYMELVWLSRQPVGGSVPPDETLAAIAGVLAAVSAPHEWALSERAAAGALIGLSFGFAGRRLEMLARNANEAQLFKAREAIGRGDMMATGKAQAAGAFNFFLAGSAGALIAALGAGPLSAAILSRLPSSAREAFGIMSVAMPVIGAGALIGSFNGRKPKALFAAGALAAFVAAKAGLAGAFEALRTARS